MDIEEGYVTDEHLLLFETERYKIFTDAEAASGVTGGSLAFLGSVSYEMYFSDSNSGSGNQHVRAQATAIGTPANPTITEQQATEVIGVSALFTIAAIALAATIRFAKYRRRVSFKSELSADDLEDWYHDSSSSF